MANKTLKIAITGAAGQIGYALLFRIASGNVFGHDTDIELQLLELEPAMSALNGVCMELDDCAFPRLKKITQTSDVNKAFSGANLVLCVGAVPRKKGMERGDLLKVNGGVFSVQGKAVNDNAADDVKVFVVGNPCNTNCLIAMHNAPDVPNDRFFAMTTLDQNRAYTQLAQKAGVDVTTVSDVVIWGNHSATQYPDFYNAKINGNAVPGVITDESWLQNDFISTVQKRGAAIIDARGASSAASAANAACQGSSTLFLDNKDDIFSMCLASKGEYGVDEGLIYSFPCQMKKGVCTVVEGIEHNDFAQEKLNATLEELRTEYNTVKDMGLI